MNILMIDDSPTARDQVRRVLQDSMPEAKFREAWDGKGTISELAKGNVDLIIAGLNVPGIGGRQFLEILTRSPLLKKKKILVFSYEITESLIQNFIDNPLVSFLEKAAGPEAIPGIIVSMTEDEVQDKAFNDAASAAMQQLKLIA